MKQDLELVGRLLNTRSSDGKWKITREVAAGIGRLINQTRYPESSVLQVMLDQYLDGADSWDMTTERLATLYSVSKAIKSPDQKDIKRIADALAAGAAVHGLLNKPWIQDALNLFNSFIVSDNLSEDEIDD